MIDKGLIEKKLRGIEQYLRELDTVKVDSIESFRDDVVTRRFIERNIELAIEQMIAVCRHLVSGLDLREPESYADCFVILGERGVIEPSQVEAFQSMARFRNVLIHAYDGIEDTVTFEVYESRLGDFRTFIEAIRRFLQSN